MVEQTDASVRRIVWCGVGIIVLVAAVSLTIRGLERVLEKEHGASARVSRTQPPAVAVPPPQLQSSPAADWQKYHAETQSVLQTYGWVDRPRGVVRVPIGRAMDLTAERGLPARKP